MRDRRQLDSVKAPRKWARLYAVALTVAVLVALLRRPIAQFAVDRACARLLPGASCIVVGIGLQELHLRDVRVQGITARDVRVRFDPIARKVTSVEFFAPMAVLAIEDGSLRLVGSSEAQESAGEQGLDLTQLPWNISVADGRISIVDFGEVVVDARLTTQPQLGGTIRMHADSIAAANVTLAVDVGGNGAATLSLDYLNLRQLSELLPDGCELIGSLSAAGECTMKEWQLEAAEIFVDPGVVRGRYQDMAGSVGLREVVLKYDRALSGHGQLHIAQLQSDGVRAVGVDVVANFANRTVQVELDQGVIEAVGLEIRPTRSLFSYDLDSGDVAIDQLQIRPDVLLQNVVCAGQDAVSATAILDLAEHGSGMVVASVEASLSDQCAEFAISGSEIALVRQGVALSGLLETHASVRWDGPLFVSESLTLRDLEVACDDYVVSLGQVGVSGSAQWNESTAGPPSSLELSVIGQEGKLACDAGEIEDLEIAATISGRGTQADVQLRVTTGAAKFGDNTARSISALLPIRFGADETYSLIAPVELAVAGIHAYFSSGDLTLTAEPSTEGFNILGKLDCAGETVALEGTASRTGDTASLQLPHIPVSLVGKFVKGLAVTNGRLSAHLSLTEGTIAGGLACEGLSITRADDELTIDGFSGLVQVADFAALRTHPGQTFTFSTASLGTVSAGPGWVDWQLESKDSLFIEKVELGWCDGDLLAAAVRLPLDGEIALTTDVRAEHLDLDKLAALLPDYNATGAGRIYGRVPMGYEEGRVKVGRGFLYSIPGQQGHLRMQKDELLTAGMAPGSKQYSQLVNAEKALRDFTYDFFRLEVNEPGASAPMHVKLFGRESSNPNGQTYNVQVNLNADLEELLNVALKLQQ